MPDALPPDLTRLAAAMGVATGYDDYLRRPVAVGHEPVRLALEAMGVSAATDDEVAASLQAVEAARAQRALPPSLVVRAGRGIPLPAAGSASVTVQFEDGGEQVLHGAADGVVLPPDLALGYHRLTLDATGEQTHLIVTPGRCPLPLDRPGFGWMAQLYAARSSRSWGIGDCADLATLATFSGDAGAAMILVNPLHATAPVLPQQPSPYSPTSRRYRNVIYLRIEDIPEVDGLSDADAGVIAALAEQGRRSNHSDRIDRDAVFTAKMQALELLAGVPRSDRREAAFRAWCDAEGDGLVDFATFCALSEHHGLPWQDWPAALRHPASPEVAAARAAASDRVRFHMWLQWLCDTQLQAAQEAARDSGMPIGIVHDLAVGVDPGGADAWALQDDLATAVTVGAPPDGFNQRGQDWALPPLVPQRLGETGYRPFREMLRSVLHHAGGIRIDHIMGLWRLWWVPQGRSAAEGTYVRYPARDLLGVLALEAHRAGALVVGEDLGTVEDGVRDALAEHRILSSRVLYFERVDDNPEKPMLPAADYPDLALSSITTHDLPTAAGWWTDEDIRVQSELGLFGESTTPAAQAARKAAERQDMLDLLRAEGLVGPDPSLNELVLAMHSFLARTPSLLVATGLHDALSDRRQPNMPGTVDEYPNWRLPLAKPGPDGTHRPLLLEDVLNDPDLRAVAQTLAARHQAGPSTR